MRVKVRVKLRVALTVRERVKLKVRVKVREMVTVKPENGQRLRKKLIAFKSHKQETRIPKKNVRWHRQYEPTSQARVWLKFKFLF